MGPEPRRAAGGPKGGPAEPDRNAGGPPADPARGTANDRKVPIQVGLGEACVPEVRLCGGRGAAAECHAQAQEQGREIVQLARDRDHAGHEVDWRGEVDEAAAKHALPPARQVRFAEEPAREGQIAGQAPERAGEPRNRMLGGGGRQRVGHGPTVRRTWRLRRSGR
jgi:hypothetical protein